VTRVALSAAAAVVGLSLLATSGLGSPGRQAPDGTFRYSIDTDVDYIDPALAHYAVSWEILYATCSMLVSYPDAPAPRGARLVPDGAAAMPTVSRDGRTYTFQVRRGRRFSDGTPITARAFERALIRVLHSRSRSPGAAFFRDIVGADAFMKERSKQVAGIAVLPGNRLRIRLTRRAPDLLARLAMPFACAVKPGLRATEAGAGAPFAGSGPYFVAEWEPKRRLVLRRNRFYRGPRPRHLGAIVYDVGLPQAAIRLEIDLGETDHGPVPANAHAELGREHGARRSSPGRYFVNPTGGIRYLVFNHERELFGKPSGGGGAGLGNVRLKQAVNFAIDRRALLSQRGAYAGVAHDQYLPPTIRGYREAALYPPQPNLVRARALARGNTRGGTAMFYACNTGGSCVPTAEIVQANLREIGLELDIKVGLPGMPSKLGVRGEPFDLAMEAWRATYLDPEHFLFRFDGRTIAPADNTNTSYFDSPEYNVMLARAASLSGQERYRAFGALDVDLARNAVPLATYMVDNDRRYFSARVRGFFSHPVYGLDLAAISVG
jgi:ABC-type oligopeptide transport system substrate-binding subunit